MPSLRVATEDALVSAVNGKSVLEAALQDRTCSASGTRWARVAGASSSMRSSRLLFCRHSRGARVFDPETVRIEWRTQ
jgi:hypothetical protein